MTLPLDTITRISTTTADATPHSTTSRPSDTNNNTNPRLTPRNPHLSTEAGQLHPGASLAFGARKRKGTALEHPPGRGQ